MSNRITKRYYAAIRMTLKTPLCISNGSSVNTDEDVIVDGDGNPFIPGSSVAGAIRAFLDDDKRKAMGFSEGEEGRMSSVFVSDMRFEKTPAVSTRDFVKLNHDKIAESTGKFDMEIIESGTETVLYLEEINREHDFYPFEEIFSQIVNGFASGEIRLGAKKNRGFGWMEVKEAKIRSFGKDNLDTWLKFVPNWKELIFSSDAKDVIPAEHFSDQYIDMELPLKLSGGISIRVYSADSGKADFQHITCHGEPVIPGSSWNGAIRERVYRILQQIGVNSPKRIRDDWFGYVEGKEALQSRVVYEESIIKGGVSLPVTRNKIDRFDQATAGTALYTDQSWFGGSTSLHIKIRRKDEQSDKAIAGMLMLVFDDIKDGYVSVGGQTAIGRGVFEADGDLKCSLKRDECEKALYKYISTYLGEKMI